MYALNLWFRLAEGSSLHTRTTLPAKIRRDHEVRGGSLRQEDMIAWLLSIDTLRR